MTTQEVAKRYSKLAGESKWVEILEELYDDSAICREPEHAVSRGVQTLTKGKEAIRAKGESNRHLIDTLHSQHCGEPIIAGDFFSVVLRRDVTFKNRPRVQLEEVGVFQVRDGKVVLEQFFY